MFECFEIENHGFLHLKRLVQEVDVPISAVIDAGDVM